MKSLIEIRLPDIGEFKNVPIIELFVQRGDIIEKDTPILTLESDKATFDFPAPEAGTIAEVRVNIGDQISEGDVVLLLEKTDDAATATPHTPPANSSSEKNKKTIVPIKASSTCEMLVLGSGPGGYSAAFRAADLGMKTVIVERYERLGGVCLNVGCIPSKALLHSVATMKEALALRTRGITFSQPEIDIAALRAYKDKTVNKLTSGLAMMAKMRKVDVIQGYGRFLDPHHLEIENTANDKKQIIRFEKAIIAVGSSPVSLPFLPDDSRIIDSTGALALKEIPKRMLVIGGGIIGLEMATVYASFGAQIDIVEMLDTVMAGADADLVAVWQKKNSTRFNRILTKTQVVSAEATKRGIAVSFSGENAPQEKQYYDCVLVAVGRTPNGKKIHAEQAGVAIDERGFISVDHQMRTNVPHVFAIGDVVGQPMLAHKAVHEAHVAAEAAHDEKAFFDARQIPAVAYTHPEIAWTGKTETLCKAENIAFEKSVFPWAASGRAIANGHDEGFTKLLFEKETRRIIGGGIVGAHAGDLIGEICLAVEMGADTIDVGKTIHPHPTLCESIGMAAEAAEGVCTDLPSRRK